MTRPKDPGAGTVRTIAGLARSVGVSSSTVQNWIASGCPRLPDGGFRVADVIAWRSAQPSHGGARRPAPGGAGAEGDASLLRLRIARGNKLAAANRRLASGLMHASVIPAMATARHVMVEALLKAHTEQIAPHLLNLGPRAVIDKLGVLDALLVDSLGEIEHCDPEAAAEHHRQRLAAHLSPSSSSPSTDNEVLT